MDLLKFTIIDMLRNKFKDIVITDTPIQSEIETKEYSIPKVLFKSYKDKKCKHLEVIDYEQFDKYGTEKTPNFENINIKDYYLCLNEKSKHKIINWDDNVSVFEIETPLKKLYEYNDILEIKNKDEDMDKLINKDFIYVYSPYNFANTLNKNTVFYNRRFNIDIFIYNDKHNEKIDYYTKEIHNLFSHDFIILNENKEKTRNMAYIYTQLNFNMSEYNISNKIVRGNMLIRTIENKRSDK